MQVGTVVFLSLVLDLFAFTIPLPLFPRLIEWYTKRESSDPDGFLSRTLAFVSAVRGLFYASARNSQKWDVVLLGGLMGSVFSTLQFIVSPYIGSLSDTHGRKRILLLTMIGNILSALVWLQSTSFASYMLSRVIGGLSEGNVQLAIAILSDVSTPATRSRSLASIGIAFALCFCLGPPIGAYFASQPLPSSLAAGVELNVYALPALLSLALLLAETAFLALCLPETKGTRIAEDEQASHDGKGAEKAAHANPPRPAPAPARAPRPPRAPPPHALCLPRHLLRLLDWDNRRNGTLLATIGILSALLQGGYVRRALARTGEATMARRGVLACALSFALLAALPRTRSVKVLYAAAALLAFTSATVVNALTAHAALLTDEPGGDEDLVKGRALGRFRSRGQLGRALGPLLACAGYWTFGPSATYAACAGAMFLLGARMRSLASSQKAKQA
ncbi:MFS general substrate transporter [Gloeophyllum trabeum ATCC 11539]|uniref:MFS general substrate transporter n=1 Tax=Gloeophyllum trabeum (strain ATCC 11539 / FP-39264 / Madison 617) TaxID=670483 RepID=S7QJE4_GLOTA|nr:MFS general substrate transporter [Gloeophyllum trabeum ATCC 11539]EPQ59477.1 MFS general substrate transporter [Gloeophyllum trabeum ATCC 11539]